MSLKSVKTLSATQLAKKWNLSLGEVGKLIAQGAAVEKEHTKNEKEAREVARDHLAERPDYYKKLKKVEKSPISMKEGISAGPEREVDHTIGDLTGSSRKVMKVDEVKISPKIRKAAAVGMTAANIATGASVYDNASRGVGSPIRDIAAAASGLPGKVGYAAMGTNYTIKGFDKAREHLRAKMKKKIEEEQIDEISAELVGKVSNARFFRGEAPSKTLTRAINKKFIESGKKDKGKINKDKKEVKEAVMAMPPQAQQPAIYGSQRAGVQRQVSRPTSVSGSASGRIAGQAGSMSAKPNVRVSSGVQPSIERTWKTPGRGTMGTSGGSMSATPKVSTAYSQGGVNVGKAMGASKQTSPVVKGMTSAGREAAAAVSKAAPMASRVAGAALRVAGGPAATAAAAVMSPTPAGAGEDEKKRQATLKDYNPYKPSGRSVADYEKQALTPQKYDKPKAPETPKVDAPQPPSRPEYFTRGQAFQAARGEAGGAGAKFSYGGKEYQTNVAGEKYASKPKQTSVTDIKETTMDTKDLINEALDDILENNLGSMKENFMLALQEKAVEKLEERKKEIASNYFAE
jgi:hypothetical protein